MSRPHKLTAAELDCDEINQQARERLLSPGKPLGEQTNEGGGY